MNLLRLSLKNLLHRPLSSFLSLILMTLGMGLVSFIILTTSQLQKNLEGNISGIDMVVGAKGSPLQLILSAIFQIDNPTGNIPLDELGKLSRNRYIKETIPLSYGDSYRGYRIIGTTPSYLDKFNAKLKDGTLWDNEFEVVIGAEVAQRFSFQIGDTFESAHGLAEMGETHDEHPFKITGILAQSGTVLDNLIITSTESVWGVHDYGENDEKEITAILVKFSSPMGLIQIPRNINQNTNYQAAIPAFEINRLMSLVDSGIKTLYILAIVIVVVSGLSVFISLYNTLKERLYELALMRTYGASRSQLGFTMINESVIIALIGYLLGLLLSRLGIFILSSLLDNNFSLSFNAFEIHSHEVLFLPIAAFIGIIAGIIPAFQVFKMDISKTLSEG